MHRIIHSSRMVYVVAAVVGLCFSFLAYFFQSVINPDAICYLQSAQSIPLGLHFAMHLCGQAHWPFYSLLIYGLANISFFSYESAAYFLNGLFSLISVLTFIAIVQLLKGTTRTLWLAAFVILAAHEFNAVRDYIIRDHGFWAFYLLSLFFLLKYVNKTSGCYVFCWSVSLVIATLFRIEGLFFLVFLPFFIFFNTTLSWTSRIQMYLRLNALALVMLSGLAIVWLFYPQYSVESFGRLGEIKFQFMYGLSDIREHFHNSKDILSNYVLSKYATQHAYLILFLTFLSWYIIQLIANLSLIYAVLVAYAGWQRVPRLTVPVKCVLYGYIIINFVITFVFLLEHVFLSKRYLLALSLVLMLWVPFALDYLYEQWQKRKWPFLLAVLFILIYAYGGLFHHSSMKQYKRDAGQWLEQHVPLHASLYSNDYQVMFYSKHFGNAIFAKAREFLGDNVVLKDVKKNYDYMALRIDRKGHEKNKVITEKLGTPVKVLSNGRGDKVVIYKIN